MPEFVGEPETAGAPEGAVDVCDEHYANKTPATSVPTIERTRFIVTSLDPSYLTTFALARKIACTMR